MDEGENQPVDILVVGGGINGAGIARDAAGRGYSVVLCEKGDLASATSSASSKLIHGGLRYLEYYEFRLVRKALKEREVLLRAAPHIVHPLDFVLPHAPHLRPAWMIRLGLFLYDHIGGRETLPGSKGLDLRSDPAGKPLKQDYRKGFQYADCWVDDARLVVLNALGAREKGAEILTRCELVHAERVDGFWRARLRDQRTGDERVVRARALVNAAGPWLDEVLSGPLEKRRSGLRLVKGSHIVVPRIPGADRAYILQNPDNRVVFVLPFERDFSLIGTTEVELSTVPEQPEITAEETAYLCDSVNGYFAQPISPGDVVWSYAGVRPLVGNEGLDASKVSRDYDLDLEVSGGGAPLLSVLGGKVTTYRVLAEDALARLKPYLGQEAGPAWTANASLPGGDMDGADFNTFLTNFRADYPWLPGGLAERLARSYGTRAQAVIGAAQSVAELGGELMPGLFEAELSYLCAQEWAEEVDDILWRRTKLGLWASKEDRERLAARLEG